MSVKTHYGRLVVLTIPGVAVTGNLQTDFTFPDQPDLRYARVTNITMLTASDLANARPAVTALVADSDIPKITFSFETNDPDDLPVKIPGGGMQRSKGDAGKFSTTLETLQYVPAARLHYNQNSSTNSFVRNPIDFANTYIIWQKTKVSIQPALANTADKAIALWVEYTFVTVEGKMIFPRN